MIGPNNNEINKMIKDLQAKYKLTNEGDLNEYLGIKVERTKDGKGCTLTQPNLIRRILKAVNFSEERKKNKRPVRTPAMKVLHKDVGGHVRQLN